MDAIKCHSSGKIHAAQSGQDYTLCIVSDIAKKLRASDKNGDAVWDEIAVGRRAKAILPLVTCRACRRVLTAWLPDYEKERCKR